MLVVANDYKFAKKSNGTTYVCRSLMLVVANDYKIAKNPTELHMYAEAKWTSSQLLTTAVKGSSRLLIMILFKTS